MEGASWRGWGNPEDAVTLDAELRSLLRRALGVRRPTPAVELDQVRLPDPRLRAETLRRLAAVVGEEHIHGDRLSRIRHTRGNSTPDLLRIRTGDANDAPDAVVVPASHQHVQELLQVCASERLAVVPYGGGTSVVGGLAPERDRMDGVLALDLRRLNRLLELDDVSRTATLEPGLRGPEAEKLLCAHGYTIGHRPQSFHFASIGGFAATRSSGEASAGYGRFDECVVGLRVATPKGTIETGLAPKSAAGPDLRQLFLGCEGAFGVITAVRVEIRPVPDASVYEAWRFASFGDGIDALRRLAQDGPTPTVLRLADETESALDLARANRYARTGCLAITSYEGAASDVAQRRARAGAILERLGAQRDLDGAERWLRDRYRTPYLRAVKATVDPEGILNPGVLVPVERRVR